MSERAIDQLKRLAAARAAHASNRQARAALVAAVLAAPAEVQERVRRRLARHVEEAKVNEADGVNAEGIAAQVEYLAEDEEAFPPACWAVLLEATAREGDRP